MKIQRGCVVVVATVGVVGCAVVSTVVISTSVLIVVQGSSANTKRLQIDDVLSNHSAH